jgi:hypothetical protein
VILEQQVVGLERRNEKLGHQKEKLTHRAVTPERDDERVERTSGTTPAASGSRHWSV